MTDYHTRITGFRTLVQDRCETVSEWPWGEKYQDTYRAMLKFLLRMASEDRLSTAEAWALEQRDMHLVARDYGHQVHIWARQDALDDAIAWFDKDRARQPV